MRILRFVFLLLIALVVAPVAIVSAQPAPAASPRLPEDTFDRAALAAHLRFLASDELMGRRAGTWGADVAARYIAEQFRAAGVRPAPGSDEYFQAVPLPREAGTSYNVVGVLEGSDPALKDEYIILMAHYDHVGAGMENGRGAAPTDSIFNGARDNGMGTVALIAAAHALAQERPARPVIFLAAAAEEMGLVGSRYYAEHPLIPLQQTVFGLNIDSGGYSDTSVVTLVGMGRTTADSLIAAGAAVYGLEVIPDPSPEQGLFDRSDNASFTRKGIPVPTFSPGFRSFSDPGVANYYHHVQDEADEDFDFDYLHRFVQAYTRAARLIANSPTHPTWQPGDEYEARAATDEG